MPTPNYDTSVQEAQQRRTEAMDRLGQLAQTRQRFVRQMYLRQEEEMKKAEAARKRYEDDNWKRMAVSAVGSVGGAIAGTALGGPLGGMAGASIGGALAQGANQQFFGGQDTSTVPQLGMMGAQLYGAYAGRAGQTDPMQAAQAAQNQQLDAWRAQTGGGVSGVPAGAVYSSRLQGFQDPNIYATPDEYGNYRG